MAGLGGDVTAPGDDLAALGADRYALVWRRSYSGRRTAALLVRTTAPPGAATTEDCRVAALRVPRGSAMTRQQIDA